MFTNKTFMFCLVHTHISCTENKFGQNFSTKNTGEALPVYKLIHKIKYPFSAGEPSSVELAAPNRAISLSTLLDFFTSHKTIFTQLHNVRLTVSDITSGLRPR
jgi:hypothetical protein